MAVVAQLVEPRVVISVVVGSSPISRPIFILQKLLSVSIDPILLHNVLLLSALAIFGIFACLIGFTLNSIYSYL